MANLTTVTRPYAKAVLDLARENNEYAKWSAMLEFLAMVAQDALGSKVLRNLSIASIDKANFICNLSAGVLNQQGENLVKLLAYSKRLEILPELLALYEKMRMQEQGQVMLHLTLAQDTNPYEIREFAHLSKITEQVDPALLAGGIAQVGNRVIDVSALGRLHAMRDLLRN